MGVHDDGAEGPVRPPSEGPETPPAVGPGKWCKVYLFRGMINDVRRRIPYYASDWLDAWDYRVVPATVYMFFAKYAFFQRTPG